MPPLTMALFPHAISVRDYAHFGLYLMTRRALTAGEERRYKRPRDKLKRLRHRDVIAARVRGFPND